MCLEDQELAGALVDYAPGKVTVPALLFTIHPMTSLPSHHKFINSHQVSCLFGKVQEEPLEGSGGASKDLTPFFGPVLYLSDDIIHILLYIGEALQSLCQTQP